MLRNTQAVTDWADRYDPPWSVVTAVWAWVWALEDKAWQFPSRPIEEMTDRPRYEVREASVETSLGPHVVIYSRTDLDADDAVDVIGVFPPSAS